MGRLHFRAPILFFFFKRALRAFQWQAMALPIPNRSLKNWKKLFLFRVSKNVLAPPHEQNAKQFFFKTSCARFGWAMPTSVRTACSLRRNWKTPKFGMARVNVKRNCASFWSSKSANSAKNVSFPDFFAAMDAPCWDESRGWQPFLSKCNRFCVKLKKRAKCGQSDKSTHERLPRRLAS